jgi:hypothetical protein
MPIEPPQNGEYLVAAYVVTAVILVGYWVWLWRVVDKSVSGKNRKREQ